MMTREEREWMDQLVMLIKAEKDPEKILVLVRELSNFLDQRELRLSHKSKSFWFRGMPQTPKLLPTWRGLERGEHKKALILKQSGPVHSRGFYTWSREPKAIAPTFDCLRTTIKTKGATYTAAMKQKGLR
jgi:hypothetical protein